MKYNNHHRNLIYAHLTIWREERTYNCTMGLLRASATLHIMSVEEMMKFKVLLIPAMCALQLPREQRGNLGLQLQAVNRLSWRLNVSP